MQINEINKNKKKLLLAKIRFVIKANKHFVKNVFVRKQFCYRNSSTVLANTN